MKKIIFILTFLLVCFILFAQQEQYDITVVNIEVPVRVLDGNLFVGNLTLQDFELYENGVPQQVAAVYQVQRNYVAKQEALIEFNPSLQRNFHLLFQLTDYNPKLSEAFRYLFEQVLLPGDTLSIQTPMSNYLLNRQVLQTKSRKKLAEEMENLVRKDTMVGNTNYNTLLKELKKIVRSIGGSSSMEDMETDSTSSMFGLEMLLPRYKDTLQKMDELRVIDEQKFLSYAKRLKEEEGQTIVFLIYQREFRPEISPSLVNQMMSMYQDQPQVMSDLQDLFQFYRRDVTLDIDKMKSAFADAAVKFNFIFMNKEPQNVSGLTMTEQSEDVFKVFSAVAEATGGVVDSSQNPFSGIKNAIEANESYYLLYYYPKDRNRDGTFRKIEVKVKDRSYKVLCRSGYYAN